ncbi:MAG: N-formylglutamate amidohydrolase [Betaproteobacteria bacterium]|nr:MAG: N-formylglutamate amidohydrolase [Betaproteobacteria bacterium]
MLLCDHASNRVPACLNNLGLSDEQLSSHIGWDPGAALLAKALAARLDAPLLLSNYSRLVIDCNRPPTAADSIPTIIDGTVIPGNAGLSADDAQLRRSSLFDPYHDAIRQLLDARDTRATRLLSIHSFTPSLAGVERPWSVGVCYRLDATWAAQWLATLRGSLTDSVGDNQPYEIELHIDYTLPVHSEARQLPGVMLEIRQDKLQDQDGVQRWSELTAQCWLSMVC